MSQFDQSSQQIDAQFIAGHDFNVFQQHVQLTDHQRMINRIRMIQRVQTIWINGILEPSLQGMVSITPRIQIQPDAIRTPWQFVIQRVSQEGSMLPTGTHITWVYDRANGEVLILGEPGSGKTILLLELARSLLERARHDESQPVPVVFMLSSWANTRLPLAEWLISELHLRYQIPPLLAKRWVEEEQILPLLDGLDEVPLSHRAACVETINAYRCKHGLLPTVVCGRLNDYQILPVRLQLSTAILVQPLSPQEVTGTLASTDQKLVPLQQALQEDQELQTLVSTPLFLKLLTVVYQHSPDGELLQHGVQREQLLAAYVQQAIHHFPDTHSTHPEAMHWLTNLARQMRLHNQSVFYLEQLQRDWLSGDKMRRVYDWMAVLLPEIVMAILAYFVMQTFFASFNPAMLTPYFVWPIIFGGILGCILVASRGGVARQPEAPLRNNSRKRLLRLLGAAAIIGFVVGLGGWWLASEQAANQEIFLDAKQVALSISQNTRSQQGIIQAYTEHNHSLYVLIFRFSYGLATGLIYFLVGIVLLFLAEKGKLRPSSSRSLTRDTWFQRLFSYPAVLIGLSIAVGDLLGYGIGSVVGEVQSLNIALRALGHSTWEFAWFTSYVQLQGLRAGLANGLIDGLMFGLVFILLGMLLMRSDTAIRPADRIIWSYKNMKTSLSSKRLIKTALQLALFSGVCVGLYTGINYGIVDSSSNGALNGWINGIIAGLSSGLTSGLNLGAMYWLLVGLFRSVSHETIDEGLRTAPNQGIRRSALNGLILATGTTFIVGVIGAVVWLIQPPLAPFINIGLHHVFNGWFHVLYRSEEWTQLKFGDHWILTGTILGLSAGLLIGLLGGWLACWRHYVLRFLLSWEGSLPRKLPSFLDETVSCILLCRVGGGYMFIHRLLLDYFADIKTTFLPEQAESKQGSDRSVQVAQPICFPPDYAENIHIDGASAQSQQVFPCGHPWRPNAHFCSVCGQSMTSDR